jgi:hypothetical protein
MGRFSRSPSPPCNGFLRSKTTVEYANAINCNWVPHSFVVINPQGIYLPVL